MNYVSHLSVPTYTYQYQIKYNYTSRFWGEQSYTVNGEIKNSDIEGMQNIIGSKNTFDLKKEFIIKKTPFEKNLRQSIKWLYDAATHTNEIVSETAESKIYKVIYNVTTEQTVDDSVTAEFKLPYSYDSDDPNYVPVKIDAYNGDDDSAKTTGTQEYVFYVSINNYSKSKTDDYLMLIVYQEDGDETLHLIELKEGATGIQGYYPVLYRYAVHPRGQSCRFVLCSKERQQQ